MKLFNRHDLKITFSSTTNFENIIVNTKQKRNQGVSCSFSVKSLCPLGTCITKIINYDTNEESIKAKNVVSYVGVTEKNSNARLNNHTLSIRHWNNRRTIKLSSYV